MASARASRDAASPHGRVPRRSGARWLVIGGAGFGIAAAAWTAIAMVTPSIVATSLSATPTLRSLDPFAPRMVVLANTLPESARVVDSVELTLANMAMAEQAMPAAGIDARTEGATPFIGKGGTEIAEGVPLLPADRLAPSLGPVLASLTPYAESADGSELAVPVVRNVETVAATPAVPAASAPVQGNADLADTNITASIPAAVPLPPERDVNLAEAVPLPPASPLKRAGPVLASLAPVERQAAPAPDTSVSVPSFGNRTAIYDIAAHTVYLPNGERLEAHSGLGGMLDDPGSVHVKMRGATPPHTYDLTPREQLFHGVAALRLTPSDGGNVYGRVGLLAHTYMLGPRGDSNGCVSFKDYNRFLRAYRNGEVTKLAVVPSLSRSASQVASRGKRSWWFASSTD